MKYLALCFFAALVAVAICEPAVSPQLPPAELVHAVPRAEILAAMQHSTGYVLTATTNGSRLQSEVLLRLIRDYQARDPRRRPLLLGHREWYEAFLERTGLLPSQAPLFARISYQYGQDLVVDYRRERVIDQVLAGPEPEIAANVRLFWPDTTSEPSEFSYDDMLSDPQLRVTERRLMTYRLVAYGDQLWYAHIHGLRGRPTSGARGTLFSVIGEARVVESRSTVSTDQVQVVRGRARKWVFSRTATITVLPNGRGVEGVPPDRPDRLHLEDRLTEPLAIRFQPFPSS